MPQTITFPPQLRGVPHFPRPFEWPFIELRWRLPRILRRETTDEEFQNFLEEYLLFAEALGAIGAQITMLCMLVLLVVSFFLGWPLKALTGIFLFAALLYTLSTLLYQRAAKME